VTAVVLSTKRVVELVDELMKDFEVVAPVESRGDLLLVPIDDAEEMTIEYSNSNVSPKDLFFPQAERLFEYSVGRGTFRLRARPERRRRLIFGIRPCDVAGLRYLDASFGGDITDPNYWSRRANTKLVCIACTKPCTESCFCTSTNTGPSPTTGFDVALTPLRDRFLAETLTESGRRILKSHSRVFEPLAEDDLAEKEKRVVLARRRFKRRVDVARVVEGMNHLFRNDIWESVAKRCLRCGGCTYVCPTCYCFDVFDWSRDSSGERLRHWDSCQFVGFGRRSGGLNARPTQVERLRQWYYHKFSYSIDQLGMLGCVGCGRCVEACIGNIDIVQVLNELARM